MIEVAQVEKGKVRGLKNMELSGDGVKKKGLLLPTMLTSLNLSLGQWAPRQFKAEADMIGFVLSGKDAGSSAEDDLGQRALLARTPLDAKGNPFVFASCCSETLHSLPMAHTLANAPAVSFTN